MSRRILIVDDDPLIRSMVGTVMGRHGYAVESAEEGREALEKATRWLPDLVITDVMMPGMDGWSLVRALRSRRELSLVPVIFLTAMNREEDRIMGFRLGADDYLAKPFRFEELELRVERALRWREGVRQEAQARRGTSGDDEKVGLKGDLAHLGVSAILTILEMERKSGILVLKGTVTGRVFMRSGRALAAFFDGLANPRGAEAIFEMLTWKAGSFAFSSVEVDMEDQIKSSTTHLLMEGARRIDEATAGLDPDAKLD